LKRKKIKENAEQESELGEWVRRVCGKQRKFAKEKVGVLKLYYFFF